MSVFKSRTATTGNLKRKPSARVLLMTEETADLSACTALLQSSGCDVQPCSSYVELLLYLEHESFQLVIIFERKNAQNNWRELIKRVAEIDRGIPVMTLSQGRDALGPIRKLRTGAISN